MPSRRTRRTRRIRRAGALVLACAAALSAAPAAQSMPIEPQSTGSAASVSLGDTAASRARFEQRAGESAGNRADAATSSLAGTISPDEISGPVTIVEADGDGIQWPTVAVSGGVALLLSLGGVAAVHGGRRRAPLGS